jgi:hypothetical protein
VVQRGWFGAENIEIALILDGTTALKVQQERQNCSAV